MKVFIVRLDWASRGNTQQDVLYVCSTKQKALDVLKTTIIAEIENHTWLADVLDKDFTLFKSAEDKIDECDVDFDNGTFYIDSFYYESHTYIWVEEWEVE